MPDPIKKISIDELSTGMYIEEVFDTNGQMLFSAKTLIVDAGQAEKLKQRGISSLYINTQKGRDVPEKKTGPAPAPAPALPPDKREKAYFQEIGKANEVYHTTLETVRKSLKNIRSSKGFEQKDVDNAATEIAASIIRNPDALISLTQIKGYDEYTYVHSVNVGIMASSLAHEMGYPDDKVLQIGIGGLLHDIGKMRVPESILNKPGKFTDWEFAVMKKHPELGLEIIKEQRRVLSDTATAVIWEHHERYNGSGYPRGLKEKAIHEAGLIGAVADVYDALTTDRVYRGAWLPQKALAFIFQGADGDYSRTVVERFTKYMGIFPVGSFVRLMSGEMGVVTRIDRGHLLSPVVLVLFDASGARRESPVEYDLYAKQKGPEGKSYQIELSLNPKAFRINTSDYLLPQTLGQQ